jgi:hypothetical protein
MKKIFIFLILIVSVSMFSQSTDAKKTRVFSFSPIRWDIEEVNGMAFGLGHYKFVKPADPDKAIKINGFNLELNPFSPVILLLYQSPFNEAEEFVNIQMNGLHLSTGGFNGRVTLNGVGISLYHMGNKSNGLTLNGSYNVTKELNGLHIAGLSNYSDVSKGVLISPFNYAESFHGVGIGVVNQSTHFKGAAIGMINIADESMTGIQIGLINISGKNKGLQVGLWNMNAKRSLPIINW